MIGVAGHTRNASNMQWHNITARN